MPRSGVHPVGTVDDAMQHLIDRADDNAGDPAARLIDLFNDALDKRVVVFEGALTGIDGIAFAEAAIFPKPRPVLLFLAVVSRLWPKKNGGSPAKID